MREIFIPTKRTEYFFVIIFIIILFLSLASFPISSFLNGEVGDASFKIGWPVAFFELSMQNPDQPPFSFKWFGILVVLYALISYLLDVIISYIFVVINRVVYKPSRNEPRDEVLDAYAQAKEAYSYYKRKGMDEKNIVGMFKERGWKEEDVKKIAS
jgi:hypothetical protein